MSSHEERQFQRTPSTQTVSWFLDLDTTRQLDLDPPYQRRSVWNRQFQQFFVDSVIRNYPTQAIFLEVVVNTDGPTRYRVLDGKQRLTALISFCQNEFSTPQSLEDIDLHETYYSDLPQDVRRRILSYMLTVENVTGARPAELNQVFDRLNRNVARLNKQELRHAQYGGAFISKMEKLATTDLWQDVGLVTPARIRRMLDVEHVSELYLMTALGVQDGKNYLDRYYAEFDDEVPDEQVHDKAFRRASSYVQKLNESIHLVETRFKNVADFYSLWAAVTQLGDDDQLPAPEQAAARLIAFIGELEDQESKRSADYLLAARQGSNKGANRELRAATLVEVLQAS